MYQKVLKSITKITNLSLHRSNNQNRSLKVCVLYSTERDIPWMITDKMVHHSVSDNPQFFLIKKDIFPIF